MACCGQPARRTRAVPSSVRKQHYCVEDPESLADDGLTCFWNASEARRYARKKGFPSPTLQPVKAA